MLQAPAGTAQQQQHSHGCLLWWGSFLGLTLLLHTAASPPSQAHLSRGGLNPDLAADAQRLVGQATRLVQSMVDVISSSGWLNPALAGAWRGIGHLRGAAIAVLLPHWWGRCCHCCCWRPQAAALWRIGVTRFTTHPSCRSDGDEPDGDASAVAARPRAHAAAALHPRAGGRLHREG